MIGYLEWQRPMDGAQIAMEEVPSGGGRRAPVVRARSDRFAAYTLKADNLENPVAISLINATTENGILDFVSRYGITHWLGFSSLEHPDGLPLVLVESLRTDILECLAATQDAERVARANIILAADAGMYPRLETDSQGKPELIMKASSLATFIALEVATAVRVGAQLARCAHCSKAFLTGPLTGRRSTATYCSDRCRVYAMRARKHAKD